MCGFLGNVPSAPGFRVPGLKMATVIKLGVGNQLEAKKIPALLQRDETAAQIVALMQSRFDRPGPEEMQRILEAAGQQVIGLRLQPSPLS